MDIIFLGGPVMWPLLAISVAVVAIIIERFLVLSGYRVPALLPQDSPERAIEAVRSSESLASFLSVLEREHPDERLLEAAGQSIILKMEKHFSLLTVLAKSATLLGLLGTVLGMIGAFFVVSSSTTGVDMSELSRGLWQALITTAAGLIIAIPAYIAAAWFQTRADAMGEFLTLAANIVLAGKETQRPQQESLS
ncbi:MotA/TolQ/ExbB proton channel family protein [uncultured Sutterella sp.]|uniref:MotA/TolQ/ExbB proton channel family protein n=1 Tax=uncultured Sutterella sp. TaxID=286133 RepID=UPI00261424F2|nr:MotA/TolQ/ExbB proton channel family protein [uncultured Sutterella sp.]